MEHNRNKLWMGTYLEQTGNRPGTYLEQTGNFHSNFVPDLHPPGAPKFPPQMRNFSPCSAHQDLFHFIHKHGQGKYRFGLYVVCVLCGTAYFSRCDLVWPRNPSFYFFDMSVNMAHLLDQVLEKKKYPKIWHLLHWNQNIETLPLPSCCSLPVSM